jgi:WD40 repeat protein
MPKYDVFLSYNSTDEKAVRKIAHHLHEAARLNPFLDRWHLVPGEPWQEALEEALDDSGSCAVFLGPAGLGTWENEEMRVALDIRANKSDFRVIPVLLPGARLPERGRLPRFLARHTWVDFRPGLDDPDAFHRLVSGIQGVAPGPEGAVEAEAICPFRGLQVFDEEHARFFYGREALTQHLVEQLRDDRFLAVIGPSGSGKSSLVRAGLVPQVRRGALPASDRWSVVLLKPGAHPLESLAARLLPHLSSKTDRLSAHQRLTAGIQQDERGLHRFVQVALAAEPDSLRLLLVVDQFEELFTLCQNGGEREQCIANLLYASAIAGGQTVVVITMRADFFARCAAYPDLASRLAERDVLVGPMSQEELRQAMEGPARVVGLDYEKGLVDTILNDLGDEPGTLPLLQHTLLELWERRRGGWLTHDAYHAIGGVQGALAQRAETVYARLTPARQEAARRVVLRLIQPGEGTEDTRRRARLAELRPAGEGAKDVMAAVWKLADARLLTTTGGGQDGDEMVDLAHEALIQGWPRLRQWIDQDRAALRTHRRLAEAADEWRNEGQHEDFVFRGARLAEAEEWAETRADTLNELERAFLEASIQAREAGRIASRRRVQGVIATLVIVLVVISLLAAKASIEQNRATHQASRLLAGHSVSQLDADYDLALLLAVEAGQTANTFEAEAALHGALTRQGPMELLAGHTAAVKRVAWNGAGTHVATASEDGTARVWDVSTAPNTGGSGTKQLILSGHAASVEYVAWNGTGTRIVTTSRDRTARVWDAESGAELAVLKGHTGQVNCAAWNPAGTHIVTTSADGTARVWDVSIALDTGGSGAELAVLRGHNDLVYQAAWDETGTRIVTVGDDGTGRVWDAASGAEQFMLAGHTDRVWQAAWNRAGTRIVTASADGTARVWDAENGTELAVLQGHQGPVYQAAWNGTGTRIVSAGADGTVRLWEAESGNQLAILTAHATKVLQVRWSATDRHIVATSVDGRAWVWEAESGEEVATLSGHTAEVLHVAWNEAGTRIVTASADGTARVRAVQKGIEVAAFAGHTAAVRHAAWNEAGTHLVTASDDGTARVWDVGNGTQVAVFTGHTAAVRHAAWNRRGTHIVTASDDHTAQVWDAASGAGLVILSGHTDRVNRAAWNEDGTRIVTASDDGTARVWDAASGAKLATLIGHTARVFHAAWNRAGTQIVTASDDDTARVWDAERGTGLAVFPKHNGSVYYAAWNAAGTRIVTASADGTARVWDVSTALNTGGNGAEVVALVGHFGGVYHAAWNETGTRIVTASSDGTARVWNAKSGAEVALLAGHEGGVECAAWNSDNTRIVTAGIDGTARVWDAQSGTEVALLRGHTAPVLQAAWNGAGTHIVTAGLDGTARVYYTRLSDLLEAACQRAVRNMTEEEWKRYMGEESYGATCSNLPTFEPLTGPTPSRED